MSCSRLVTHTIFKFAPLHPLVSKSSHEWSGMTLLFCGPTLLPFHLSRKKKTCWPDFHERHGLSSFKQSLMIVTHQVISDYCFYILHLFFFFFFFQEICSPMWQLSQLRQTAGPVPSQYPARNPLPPPHQRLPLLPLPSALPPRPSYRPITLLPGKRAPTHRQHHAAQRHHTLPQRQHRPRSNSSSRGRFRARSRNGPARRKRGTQQNPRERKSSREREKGRESGATVEDRSGRGRKLRIIENGAKWYLFIQKDGNRAVVWEI